MAISGKPRFPKLTGRPPAWERGQGQRHNPHVPNTISGNLQCRDLVDLIQKHGKITRQTTFGNTCMALLLPGRGPLGRRCGQNPSSKKGAKPHPTQTVPGFLINLRLQDCFQHFIRLLRSPKIHPPRIETFPLYRPSFPTNGRYCPAHLSQPTLLRSYTSTSVYRRLRPPFLCQRQRKVSPIYRLQSRHRMRQL